MSHQIVEVRINGARGKVLVQEHMPVYYPNLYVTLELAGRALNTKHKYLEHIGLVEKFLAHEGIDLIARLERRPSSRYLTDSEISRLVADAALHKSVLDKKYAGARLLQSAYKIVGRVHAQQRLEAAREYLKFLYEKLGDEVTRYTAIDDVEGRINRKIISARPSWKKNKNEDIKGLTDQERERLLQVMHPSSVENPFANEAIKLRNYIILLLGLEMGLRRSEMLLIKLSDISWHKKELSVVNLENEGIDPRTLAPQFKTHERILVMGDELLFAIKTYVDTYRTNKNRPPAAKEHPFLLISHRRNEGKPLSVKALDGIFPRASSATPELTHVHPHLLRHDAVYTLLESMRKDLEKLTPEDRTTQVQKVLTYAFGWSSNSDMPGLYGAKFWKEEANRAMQIRSDNFKAKREKKNIKLYESDQE